MSSTTSTSKGGYPAGTKIYRALITQSGTADPVATVLTNTFGSTPVWTRAALGEFRVTLSNAFPRSRTMIMINPLDKDHANFTLAAFVETVNSVKLDDTNGSDGTMLDLPIEIIVYPP